MRALVAPAVGLMNRLRYPQKFLLLGSAVAVLIAALLTLVYQNLSHEIEIADNELVAVQILKPLNRAAQFMQQHRGLSAGLLGGNEAMRQKRVEREKDVGEALQATTAVLTPFLRDSGAWKKVLADWERLRSQGLGLSVADNVRAHTQLIDQLLLFMVEVSDAETMTLDPAMGTYYMMDTVVLKMPAMLERLGQTRARGTGVLAKKEISPQMRIDIASTLSEMSGTLRAQSLNLDKVVRYAPTMQAALAGPTREFADNVDKVIKIVREDILGEQFTMPPQDYFNLSTAVIDSGYKTMFEVLIPAFEQQIQARRESSQRLRGLAMLASAGVLLLVCYLALGMYYSVIDSVSAFSAGARRLAEGDLSARFDTAGHDELHAAGQDFDNMAIALRKLLQQIQRDVQSLRSAAEELATTSHQISTSAGAQSDSASSMAASVEEMTVSIDHISRNAESAQVFSRESDAVAERGAGIVGEVVGEIRGIASTVNHSADAVESLGHQSDRISVIVGTIKEIADQTNLLALNAAIEAARAGESGRGFAVVADEVRKLAERTTKSTQEIAEMIGSIQSGTATAVSSMKSGVDRVASGVAQAQAAGEAIVQVRTQSQQVVSAVSEITQALREQVATSTEIARNVERIARVAEENNASAGNNALTADRLRQMAEALSNEVAHFRT